LLALKSSPKQIKQSSNSHTGKYKCTTGRCGDQLHKHQGTCAASSHRTPGYKHFLTSNLHLVLSARITLYWDLLCQ